MIFIAIAVITGFGFAIGFAILLPQFLLYETPPIAADAVVLFAGHDSKARGKQVNDLIAKELVKFVIMPASGKIFEAQAPDTPIAPDKTAGIAEKIKTDTRRSYVEQTHIEMLQALALMDHIGATSANFVSSPYHMRRIKIMAGKVFDADKYKIAFVPTAHEPRHVPWFTGKMDLKWVFSEWGKIIWFLMYSPFV